MTMNLNFPVINGLEPIQKYLRSLLEKQKVTCYLCKEKIDIMEVVSPYIGLPKIIQQALFTDYFVGTNYVWDSGIYLEKHDKAFSGYIVRTREPKAGTGMNLPLLALIYDCVKTGVVKNGNGNQLHLDNLPVLSMKNISGHQDLIPIDWEKDMAEFFATKEKTYTMITGTEGVQHAFVR